LSRCAYQLLSVILTNYKDEDDDDNWFGIISCTNQWYCNKINVQACSWVTLEWTIVRIQVKPNKPNFFHKM